MSRKNKKIIRQSVQILNHKFFNLNCFRKLNTNTFCSPANTTRSSAPSVARSVSSLRYPSPRRWLPWSLPAQRPPMGRPQTAPPPRSRPRAGRTSGLTTARSSGRSSWRRLRRSADSGGNGQTSRTLRARTASRTARTTKRSLRFFDMSSTLATPAGDASARCP